MVAPESATGGLTDLAAPGDVGQDAACAEALAADPVDEAGPAGDAVETATVDAELATEPGTEAVVDAQPEVDAAELEANVTDVVDAVVEVGDAAVDAAKDVTNACNAQPPQPTNLPNACSPVCPAPYPCYCQTCPWLPMPDMNVARHRHKAVWTGKWVVVAGNVLPDSQLVQLTGERWKPGMDKWEMIGVPIPPVENSTWAGPIGMIWTGKVVMIMPSYGPWYRYKVDTDTAVPAALYNPQFLPSGQPHAHNAVWAGGRVVVEREPGLAMYDPEKDGWSMAVPPAELLPPGAKPGIYVGCYGAYGDDVYVFAPDVLAGSKPTGPWPNGTDWKKNEFVVLRYKVSTGAWSLLPAKVPAGLGCYAPGSPPVVVTAKDLFVLGWGSKDPQSWRLSLSSQVWAGGIVTPPVFGSPDQTHLVGDLFWIAGFNNWGAEGIVGTDWPDRPAPLALNVATAQWQLTTVLGACRKSRNPQCPA